jgi:hypothetical protein
MAQEKKGKAKTSAKAKAAGPKVEEKEVKSEDLLDEVKRLIKEGNVRRIIVKAKDGRELLNLPLTAGIIGLVLAPVVMAIGAIVGLAKEFTIVIERRED